MDSSIPPMFSSSPPPFEENLHEDDDEDDQFSDFGKFSVLDEKFDPDFPEDIPKSNINLPLHPTLNHEIKPQLYIDLNNHSDTSDHITRKFSTKSTDNEQLSLNSNYGIPEDPRSIDCSSEIPINDSTSSESNSERHENSDPKVELPDNSVLSIGEVETANVIVIQPLDAEANINMIEAQPPLSSALVKDKNSNILSDCFSDQFENSDLGINEVIHDQIVTSTEVLLEEEKEISIEPDQKIKPMTDETTRPALLTLTNLPANDSPKIEISVAQDEQIAQKEQDHSADFEEFFDTRPQVAKHEDSTKKLHTSDHIEDFGNFATFDVFSQPKTVSNFSDEDFDDFGDFVEVSEVTAEKVEPKPHGRLSPIPLVSSACVQLLESVFPEDGSTINTDDSENIDLFSDSDQVNFFDKVTDFDHGSGLTVKWSWNDTQFGRSILEFVGIDPKNVIKSDKGFIYVPDFASDLSFSPLKPERMAFPVDQGAKKSQTSIESKETVMMSDESCKLSAFIQSQPHRSLPLNLNPGKLPKEPNRDGSVNLYIIGSDLTIQSRRHVCTSLINGDMWQH
ncbi:hypothetical protein QYM36_013824 [Artemia franciscana]|uniref:Aftiphilin clathrin-binding box domain-containing protein n=1 Tax=Artemia franciscana TaxID=6661 RepID=A0AA88HFC0_ARTSF|nr:hypothetical protein QYM36_013824 [Artemia franciscana]